LPHFSVGVPTDDVRLSISVKVGKIERTAATHVDKRVQLSQWTRWKKNRTIRVVHPEILEYPDIAVFLSNQDIRAPISGQVHDERPDVDFLEVNVKCVPLAKSRIRMGTDVFEPIKIKPITDEKIEVSVTVEVTQRGVSTGNHVEDMLANYGIVDAYSVRVTESRLGDRPDVSVDE
jgi:hypothetical protein